MAVSIPHLRRWIAGALVFICAVIAGTYFIARHKVENALKQVPDKLGYQIQQSAAGFTISKSEQGRTLFKVQASKAVQFKEGHAQLHDVTITIYGRDGSRFDQVYGANFDYDQKTGDVTSHGEVSIDLQANPQGLTDPDQSTPKELKNPIHVRTTDLVFNQKTGDGWTAAPLEFSVPQADGSAVGAKYTANDGRLLLQSQVKILVHQNTPSTILAQQAVLEKNPREILLTSARAQSPDRHGEADEATLYLREDNTLDHAIATGNVRITSEGRSAKSRVSDAEAPSPRAASSSQVTAERLEMKLLPKNRIENAVLSGNVVFTSAGSQSGETKAGRALLTFGLNNELAKIHAEEGVRMLQHPAAGAKGGQEVEVTAPTVDYLIADGRRFTRAETFGRPQISLQPTDSKQGPIRITSDKFIATFDSLGQVSQVHGEAHARVVSIAPAGSNPPQPDRISTSDIIDGYFRPGTGIESAVQLGHFEYTAGAQRAFANRARYTPANQIAVLSGSPRVLDTGMETTADTVRLNRATGEAFGEGDVKTTYNDVKAQPNGALLASSDPIHVTAEIMSARNSPAIATYTGNARLWQDANLVKAPWIQFEKDPRRLTAQSNSDQKVATFLVQSDQSGKVTPVEVISDRLTYVDSERQAHYEGNVTVHVEDMTVTSNQMDVFLQRTLQTQAAAQKPATAQTQTPARLDKIIATASVVLTQPNRRGTGDKLVYTAADDKFVLTGGPPSIFDAEHGKITGVSLTLFRTDDRVIVEGDSSLPAITQTRVVR
jgi:lipopolysaccharide export system protein LptA